MEQIKRIIRKIRRQEPKQVLDDDIQKFKTIDYVLRDKFENFLDILYKKEIDRYSEVKALVRDYTELSSALIQGKHDVILDFLYLRFFPAFLFILVDKSLWKDLNEPIFSLKNQVSEIWDFYLNHQSLEKLKESNESYFTPIDIQGELKKDKQVGETEKEEEEGEVEEVATPTKKGADK